MGLLITQSSAGTTHPHIIAAIGALRVRAGVTEVSCVWTDVDLWVKASQAFETEHTQTLFYMV